MGRTYIRRHIEFNRPEHDPYYEQNRLSGRFTNRAPDLTGQMAQLAYDLQTVINYALTSLLRFGHFNRSAAPTDIDGGSWGRNGFVPLHRVQKQRANRFHTY